MLQHLLRTAPILLRGARHRDGTRISRLHRRVRLRELDYNRHMNQAVYAQVSELGRTDWVLRSGAWDRLRAEGVNPVVAEQRLVYRRELRPWMRYTLDTRAVEVQGRLLLFEGWIFRGAVAHTLAETKMIFVGPEGVLSSEAVHALCDDLLIERLPVRDWKLEG